MIPKTSRMKTKPIKASTHSIALKMVFLNISIYHSQLAIVSLG